MAATEPTPFNDEQCFWNRVDRPTPDACWEWQGPRNNHGYGVCAAPRPKQWILAHRHAWTFSVGPIPKGLCVLHRCDNPPCCNPAHLFLGTMKDNTADMISKGRAWKMLGYQRSKTHCPSGHPYDSENTHIRTDGARECRTCKRARYRATYANDPAFRARLRENERKRRLAQ